MVFLKHKFRGKCGLFRKINNFFDKLFLRNIRNIDKISPILGPKRPFFQKVKNTFFRGPQKQVISAEIRNAGQRESNFPNFFCRGPAGALFFQKLQFRQFMTKTPVLKVYKGYGY